MRVDVYLEDVLEDYSLDDALHIIAGNLQYRFAHEKVWFIERLIGDLMEEDFDEYVEMMKNIKELESDKFGDK
jgi:hypothetical protein